jgi:hypothetical protein
MHNCHLTFDWAALGMNSAKATLYGPGLKGFQPETKFRPDQAIPIPPGRGWLLLLSEEPHADVPFFAASAKGNLAWYRPAHLLSLDASRTLPANGGILHALNGVDGNVETCAQASNEYAWTYQVNLESVYSIKRVVVVFGRNHATEFKITVSADGANWRELAYSTEGKEGRHEFAFAPTSAQFVRVLGIRPDGPEQVGSQMSIAELEVYE